MEGLVEELTTAIEERTEKALEWLPERVDRWVDAKDQRSFFRQAFPRGGRFWGNHQ